MRESFESEGADSLHYLASRSIGGLDNDPGITYPHKLHRKDAISSHQYVGKKIVRKTGIQAQCVSVISSNERVPFPGAGDLYFIDDKGVASDIYGLPAIYSGDAATQLKTWRPFNQSAPKSTAVAYVRREHRLPPESFAKRFVDKYSVHQLPRLSDLFAYHQEGHNEVVTYLDSTKFCGSFLYLKNPNDENERRQKETALIIQRARHRQYMGRELDKLPVVEFRKNSHGKLEMISRDDLASASVFGTYRQVIGSMPKGDREAYITNVLSSFYFAKPPGKDVAFAKRPFTSPSAFTNLYVKFFLVRCAGTLPVGTLMDISRNLDQWVAEAERERQLKKARFNLHQKLLAGLGLEEDLRFGNIVADNGFVKHPDFVRKDDGTPYYKFDYTASGAVRRYERSLDGQTYHLVVAPVGFNQNWRFPEPGGGSVPRRNLKPSVFEVSADDPFDERRS